MTHALRERHPHNAVGNDPLVCSLRYRCECATNEVLQISAVIDMNSTYQGCQMTLRCPTCGKYRRSQAYRDIHDQLYAEVRGEEVGKDKRERKSEAGAQYQQNGGTA